MTTMESLRAVMKQRLAKFQVDLHTKGVIAYVGQPNGTLYDTTNPGHVWVSTADMPPVSVLNKRVVVTYGMPVVVGFDPHEPSTLQILSGGTIQQDMYAGESNTIPSFTMSVPPHAATHTLYGGDTVWVDKRMLTQSRLTAATYYSGTSASGSAAVAVLPDLIYYSGYWISVPYQVFDLTAYIPGSGSSVMVAASYAISGSSATVQFTSGSVASGYIPALSQYPVIPTNNILIGAVRLWGGMTFTHEDKDYTDFVDGRTLLAQGGSGSGGGGGGMTNPMTNRGDMIWGGASGAPTRLPPGTNGYMLAMSSGSPAWVVAPSGTISGGSTNYVTYYTNATTIQGTSRLQWDYTNLGLRIDRHILYSTVAEPFEVVDNNSTSWGGNGSYDSTMRLRCTLGPATLTYWAGNSLAYNYLHPDTDGVYPGALAWNNASTAGSTAAAAFRWLTNNGSMFAMKITGAGRMIIGTDAYNDNSTGTNTPAMLDVMGVATSGSPALKIRDNGGNALLAVYDNGLIALGNLAYSEFATYSTTLLINSNGAYNSALLVRNQYDNDTNFEIGVNTPHAMLKGAFISWAGSDYTILPATTGMFMDYNSIGYLRSMTSDPSSPTWQPIYIRGSNFFVQDDGRVYINVNPLVYGQQLNLPNNSWIGGVTASGSSGVRMIAVDTNNYVNLSPDNNQFMLGGILFNLSDTTNGHVLTYNSGTSSWGGAAAGAGGLSLGAATPQAVGTAAVGSSGSASHEDHVHAHGAQVGGSLHNVATSGSAGFMPALSGSAGLYLSGAGTWTQPAGSLVLGSATPQPVGATGAAGSSGSAAAQDHIHAHGSQLGGALHSLATSGSAGFMPILSGVPTQYLSGSGTFTVVQAIGATSGSSLAVTGALTSSGGGVGYVAGAGGSAVQATSRATGVTLNKLCGTIAMFSGSQGNSAAVSFVFTNSFIASTDFVMVEHNSSSNGGAWAFSVLPAAGSCTISIRNVSGATITEATPLRFAVIKAATS